MATDGQRAWNSSRQGFRPPGHQPPKLTPRQREQIRQRLAGAETLRALATESGVSPSTIHGCT